jgi:hypothetical protein
MFGLRALIEYAAQTEGAGGLKPSTTEWQMIKLQVQSDLCAQDKMRGTLRIRIISCGLV